METCPTIWGAREMTLLCVRWVWKSALISWSAFDLVSSETAPVLFSVRMVRGCRRYRGSSWASWWSGVWRAWPAPGARPAPASSKTRATATLRKRKKVRAKHGWLPFNAHTPPLPCLSSPAVCIPSPLLLPSCTGTKPPHPPAAPLDCCWAWAWWDVSSSCSAVQSLQWEPLSPHWVWGGDCLFPVLTWLLLCSRASAQARHLSHVVRWCVIFGLISCLLRWAGGRTPCEFLQHQDAGATFHLSYERHE